MLIQELITKLREIKREQGNLPVFGRWEGPDDEPHESTIFLRVEDSAQSVISKPGYKDGFKRLIITEYGVEEDDT